jgi:hypothetical protein
MFSEDASASDFDAIPAKKWGKLSEKVREKKRKKKRKRRIY